MKVLFSVFLFTAFVSIGQTLDDADKLFNRYEYSKAINAYEKYQATKKLSLISGSFRKKSFEFSDII